MADNVIMSSSGPLRTIQEVITANQVTPYIAAVTDLRNGPVVLEVPAATEKGVLYGQIVDAWQSTIAGVGPVGEDKGAGGKYLFLPPGYKDPVPSGYFVVPCTTYRILFAFRSVALGGATEADATSFVVIEAHATFASMTTDSVQANANPGMNRCIVLLH